MTSIKKGKKKKDFIETDLRRNLIKQGFNSQVARAIAENANLKIKRLKEAEISHEDYTKIIGESVLESSPANEHFQNVKTIHKYFSWSELLPTIKTHSINPIPNIVTFAAPSGRYIGDHISASRHITVALWSHMNTFGEMTAKMSEARRIQVKNAAYAAAIHFARAEAAIADASLWRISPSRNHHERETARLFLRDKRDSLVETSKQIQKAIEELEPLTEVPLQRQAGDEKETTDKSKNAAQDAVDQATLILESILRLIRLLGGDTPEEDDDELDALTEAVTGLAQALGAGAQAAIVGAIGDVIEVIADTASATPEDIDVNIDPETGETTIYFRIEYSCLFVFDFLLDDDFVWIRKNTRTGAFTFSTGESAQSHHNQHLNSQQQNQAGE